MSTWSHKRRWHWAIKGIDSGNLVGSREGGPLLQPSRRMIRAIAKFNKIDMREHEFVKVRIQYVEVSRGERHRRVP